MANVNEISVPVRLKVMQDSIANFQKILDNLQPNTNNWKALSKLLNTMVSDSQKLQAQMSTPFNSQKDFNQTERTISKLEESAARFSFAIKQIQFSDLKLDQSQIEELQKYEQEIENIRNAYKKLQEDTKEKLLSNETNSNLIGNISASTLTKDFDAIEKSVDTHIKSLNSKVDEYKKNLSQFQNNIQLGDQATALTTSGLSKTSLGATIFDKYLTQLSDGNLHFKLQNGNTKKALLTEIEQMFNLTPGELQPLATKTINQINQAFQDMSKRGQLNVFDKIISRGNTAKKSTPIANDELTTLQSQLQEYRTLYAEIQRLKESSGINNFNTNNQSAITDAEQKLQKLQNTILQGITANEQYKNSASALANEFPRVRNALGEVNAEFLRQQSVMNNFNSMKMTVANFMGFYQVLNLTKRAIKDAANHIKELDSVMNKISIVTNMDTSDLWGQIDQYSKMAQTYGTTIKGAYEVSQIYYQQGLETADVLTLTNETLKLAKVSGLDYAATTDYMTTALRGFKMEMSEAATVVDVYSNLAANTAVSQEELAVAMSKTASSMESVGSSFQETSAMIATMVAVTRESATNIGSALKSIAARYGEMKSDPLAMTDSEGEELVYNKVDAALQSVGITLKDTEGQFRNFTDVITELAEKWDQLESTQQRYIATQFAGNRQQSRFLALVSNKDLLAENIAVAENSEDVGTVQALKALDSLESKIEQVRVAYQQFYTTIGIEDVWKGFLDGAKSVVNTLNGMPKLFGKLPIGAINAIAQVVNLLKTFAFQGLQQTAFLMGKGFKAGMDSARSEIQGEAENTIQQVENTISGHESVFNQLGTKLSLALANGFNMGSKSLITDVGQKFGSTQAEVNQKRDWMNRVDYLNSVRKNGETVPGQLSRGYTSIADEMKSMGLITQQAYNIITQGGPEVQRILNMLGLTAVDVNAKWKLLGNGINMFGQALNMISLAINTTTKEGKTLSGVLQMIAGVAITAGAIIKSAGEIAASGWKAIPFVAIASGIIAIINGVSQAIQAQSTEAKIEELTAKAEELSNKAKQLQSDYKTIDSSIKKIKELEKTRYDSAEAAEEYQTAVDKLAETYPLLVSSYDANNEAVLNVTYMEDLLAEARDKSAAATLRAVEAEAETAKTKTESYKNDLKNANNDWLSSEWTGQMGDRLPIWYTSEEGEHLALGTGAGTFAPTSWKDLTVDMAKEFNTLFYELNTAMEEADSEKTIAKIGEIYNLASKYNLELSDTMEGHLADAEEKAMALQENLNTIAAANHSTVTSWMNLEYRSSSSNSIFNEVPELFNQAVEALYSEIQAEKTPNFSRSHIANVASKLFQGVDNALVGVTEARKKEIQDILSHPEQYSSSDIQQLIPELKDTDWLLKTFEDPIEYNKKQIEKKFDQISEDNLLSSNQLDLFKGIDLSNLTLNLRNLLTSGINQATALEKNGQNSTEFISQFINFYKYAAGLPAQLRNSLIDQFESNGFTYEGLEQTQAWIDKTITEGDKFDLSGLKNTYIPNFSLSLQTMQSTLEDNLGDLETLFSDLSGGVKASKLDDAIASASKLGVTLTKDDFYADGEKMVLKYENFGQLLAGIQEKYSLKTENLTSMLNRAIGTDIDDNDTEYEYLTKDIDAIRSILGEEKYAEYYENGQLREGIDESQVIEAIHNAYDALNGEYQAYNNWVTFLSNQFTKNIDWQHGDYSSLEGTTEKSWKEGKNVVTGTAFDRIRYLAAHPGEMTETERDSTDLRNAVDTYQSGIKSLLSDITTKSADEIITNSNNYKGLAPEFVEQIAKDLQSGDLTVYKAIQLYAQEAGNTVAETNDLIVEAIEKNTLHGSTKAASELARGTFTLSNLNDYVTKYGVKQKDTNERNYSIDQFFDEAGQLTGPLSNVYQWDEASAAYKATGTLDDVIQAWEAALGVTLTKDSELYQELIQGWTSDAVKNADKADWGKQMASGISSLSSAKVGTRVDLSKSPELQAKLQELGYNVTDGYYEVVSEYARDSMLLQLESTDAEVNATLRPLQEQIKQKRAKGAATQGIMGQTATRDAFRKYLQYSKGVAGADTYQDSTIDAFAKLHGYVWDKDLQQYTATLDALTSADKEIQEAIENGASDEYIKQLREKRGELAAHFRKDEKRDALSNLLSNYEDAGDYIDEFNTQFGTDLEKLGIATLDQTTGKYKINIDKLKTQFPEIAEKYQDLLDNWQDALIDEYINNISKAGSILTQGTTSQADISAFKEAYAELTKGTVDVFYDSVLNAWTISATDMQTYIEAAANKLGLTGDAKADYVNAQIKALTVDTLDFSKYLSGSASAEDQDILKRNLKNYYETHKPEEYDVWPIEDQLEWVETINKFVDDDLETLSQGGTDAVKKLQSYGKELSTEEIEAAYRAQVAPLVAISEKLSELQVGSIVAKNQIDALNTAGFTVDENGVVTAVGDMVEAYKSIYDQMKATGEATTAELNAALGKYLDNRNGEQQAIDALSNASSMTYSQFTEIFTNAGKELTEEMVNSYEELGIIKGLGGDKMMISNFEKFADLMGWDPTSEEYTSALRAYNDNLIEYNKHVETNIKSEFEALNEALPGREQQFNVTQIEDYINDPNNAWNLDSIKEQLALAGATLENGILTLTRDADLDTVVSLFGEIGVEAGALLATDLQEIKAKLKYQKISQTDSAIQNIASNYDTVSTDMIKSLADAIGKTYNEVASYIGATENGNGTYTVSLGQLYQNISNGLIQVSEQCQKAVFETIGTVYDNAVSAISTAVNYTSSGTNNMADMAAFVNKYNDLLKPDKLLTIDEAFIYDTLNNTFTLNNQYMTNYIEAQKAQLKALGFGEAAINAYIYDQTTNILQQAFDITDFINSNPGAKKTSLGQQLVQQIRDIYSTREEELTDEMLVNFITAIDNGGQAAVDALIAIKGIENVTSDELVAAFNNSSIVKLRNAVTDVTKAVGETITGASIEIMQDAGFELARIDDNTAVITAVGNMVDAYVQIYARMLQDANVTTADLNNTYAKLLTAKDQSNIDIVDALSNATDMTYETLATLLTKYSEHTLQEVTDNPQAFGIQMTGMGKVAIKNWEAFAKSVWNVEDLAEVQNNPQYISAFKSYNDALIEMNKSAEDAITEEVKSIGDMKRGGQLNLTTLWTKLEQAATEAIEFSFEGYNGNVSNMGHRKIVPDEIMDRYFGEGEGWGTIYGQTYTAKSLVSDVQENVGMVFASLDEAGHAVEDLEDYVTRLVSKSMASFGYVSQETIKTLDSQQRNLMLYAEDYDKALSDQEVINLTDIQAEALHAAEEQAYNIIDVINGSLRGYGATFEDGILTLSENANLLGIAQTLRQMVSLAGVEIADNLAEIEDAINEVLKTYSDAIIKGIQGGMSHVEAQNLSSYAKDLGVTSKLQFSETAEGLKLSNKSARELYSAIKDIDAMQGELVFQELKESLIASEDQFKSMSSTAAYIQSLRDGTAYPDNSGRIADLEEELALAERINAERSTSEDSSFNFMDNSIPAAQNNPLNYWQNWADAFKAMKEAGSASGKAKNTIGYQDFYNIVTEMGNLVDLTGTAITLGEHTLRNSQDAADLITQAAEALSNVDGEMKIDLSKIGIDFSSGLDALGEQLDGQVDALADSQIDMLDSLISVLEIIVAMEKLGDIDVDNNGKLELGEIFEVDITGDPIKNIDGLDQYTKKFKEGAQKVLEYADQLKANGDSGLYDALDNVRIGAYTLRQMFKDAENGVKNIDLSAEEYQAAMSALYQAMTSGDYDLDNIGESLMNILENAGLSEVSVDVGTKTYYLNGQNKYVVNWDDEEAINGAIDALNASGVLGEVNQENIKEKINAAVKALNDDSLEINSQQYLNVQYGLKIATGEIQITEDEKAKDENQRFTGTYGGETFHGADKAQVQKAIQDAMSLENEGFNFNVETDGSITGSMKISTATIGVRFDKGKKVYTFNGTDYDTKSEAVAAAVAQGFADEDMAGERYIADDINGKTSVFEVEYDQDLQIAYSLDLVSGQYYYKGKPFDSPQTLFDYAKNIDPILNDKDWKTSKSADKKYEYKENGTIKITHNLETGEVTYTDGNVTFKDAKSFAEYYAAKQLAEAEGDGNVEIGQGDEGNYLSYTYKGRHINLKVDAQGNLEYIVTIADRGSFIAHNQAELETGLAAAAAITNSGGELSAPNADQSVEFTLDGQKFTVKVSSDGKVDVEGLDDNDPMKEKIISAVESQLTSGKQTNPEAEISGLTVTLADGATVEIGDDLTAAITSAIDEKKDTLKTAGEKIGKAVIEGVSTSLDEMKTKMQNATASIQSHWDNLKNNITTAIEAIKTAIKGLQQHVSFTWEISLSSQDPLLSGIVGNYAGEGAMDPSLKSPGPTGTSSNIEIPAKVTLDVEEFKADLQTIESKLNDLATQVYKIKLEINKDEVSSDLTEIATQLQAIKDYFPLKVDIVASLFTGITKQKLEEIKTLLEKIEEKKSQTIDISTSSDLTTIKSNLTEIASALSTISGAATTTISVTIGEGTSDIATQVSDIATEVAKLSAIESPSIPVNIEGTGTITWSGEPENTSFTGTGDVTWSGEPFLGPYEATGNVTWYGSPDLGPFQATGTITWTSQGGEPPQATGNVGRASGTVGQRITGPAHARSTLMGELGPELVVSNGRYFVAGQNGAEMVDLDKDAIVFNHLQTEQLLKNGMSKQRGRAVTNERNAVAFAKGNVNGGPAMASASAALAALKQLRAMWESLRSASVSDLAGAAGGGGGGGGGGSNDNTTTPEEWVALVERWYNLTQEIAKLEKEITHEEELRSKLQGDFSKNGKAYYQSQKRSLQALKDQIQAQEQLNLSRENYFDQRRAALEKTPLGNIYEFDEKGQMKFKDNLNANKFNGHTNAFDFLQDLYGYDKNGKANYTNEQKYNIMQKAGLGEYMLYDSNGTKINKDDFDDEDEYYKTVTEQVKDRIDDYASATQSLWDEIQTGKDDLLKLQQDENEILQEMRDNQMDVEDKVLDALEDMKQREIDALQDERDKLEESVGKYIDGLNNALDNEQKMYDTQDSQNELDTKKRRLGILQRSGASAADVSALQSEILQSEKDMYFNAQQAQINAIQEASDLEIARLDSQIAIMQETLDYQKEFGLLWYQVYDVMQGSAEQITTFIMGQNSQFWSQSPLKNATDANDILFSATLWKEYRDDIASAKDSLVTIATASQREIQEKDYKIFDEAMKKEFGNDYDKKGKYKDLFNEEYANGEHAGDITEVSATVRATYTHDAALAKRKKEAGQYWTHTGPDRYISINDSQHWHYKYKKETIEGVTGYYFTSKSKEDHEWKGEKCSKCGHKKPAPQSSGGGWSGGGGGGGGCSYCGDQCVTSCTKHCMSSCWGSNGGSTVGKSGCTNCTATCKTSCKNGCRTTSTKPTGKASGGFVSHGIYELGEQGTETVFTAEQTQVLRNNILSNRPNSLISLLKSYNESYSNISKPLTGVTTAEDNSTNIETVELNMNVQQIANDYDARRAGEQALSEIMRIARKTSAANSIRR